MSTKPAWVMTIPVISTVHMPKSYALDMLPNSRRALTPEGGFLLLYDDPAPGEIVSDAWTVPIGRWLHKEFGWQHDWVRFDCDADVIEGLPVYDW